MCGIVGFTQPDGRALDTLNRMMAPIHHRGPDASGHHLDKDLAVGHLRLTIVDPVGGRQPTFNSDSGDVLVFNGELYGFTEHREFLFKHGVEVRDESDTEVLFQLLRLLGVQKTLSLIDGMFAFAFRDGRSGALYIARDRFGEKPLYYSENSDQLIFASEIKALIQHPACRAVEYDFTAISAYMAFDYVPAPNTGLIAIKKLGPGEYLTFRSSKSVVHRYWSPEFPSAGNTNVSSNNKTNQTNRLTQLLDDSIAKRLVADVPVGLFLSGGVDSSLIAARARRLAPEISAYTIQFSGSSYDETPYAKSVAQELSIRHNVISVGKSELYNAIDELEQKIDEPFADSSIIPTYLLCKAARSDVTVALGGDGADELFAGYMNFSAQRITKPLSWLPKSIKSTGRKLNSLLPVRDTYMGLNFKLGQLINGFGEEEQYQALKWMSAFDVDETRQVLTVDIKTDPVVDAIDKELGISAPQNSTERLQYLFCRLYLANNILPKVDRASMYNSLEVRSPFLSNDIAEFALSLPPELKLCRGESKVILRHLAKEWFPKSIASRPKHGFALPVSNLLRGDLADRINSTLLDNSNPMTNFFRKTKLEQLIREHANHEIDHRKKLWSLYSLFVFAKNIENMGSVSQV